MLWITTTSPPDHTIRGIGVGQDKKKAKSRDTATTSCLQLWEGVTTQGINNECLQRRKNGSTSQLGGKRTEFPRVVLGSRGTQKRPRGSRLPHEGM